MLLGLLSLLFQTKVKAAAASMTRNFAHFVSDSLHLPTDSAGQAAQQLSFAAGSSAISWDATYLA